MTLLVFLQNRAIKKSDCIHKTGDKELCHTNGTIYVVIFGIAEIVFSQIPDFDQLWWLSILAAVMSFTYSTIGLGLGIGQVIGTLIVLFMNLFNVS